MTTDYWPIIEPDFDRVSIYDGPDRFLADIKGTPEWRVNLLAVHWCDSEVCNGGFDQFFFNNTAVLAPEAVLGYRAIARPDLADLLQQAMERLRPTFSRDRRARQRALKGGLLRKRPDFEDLDDRYYALMREPDVYKSMGTYAAAHTNS